MKTQLCRGSTDAVAYWRLWFAARKGVDSATEQVWVLTVRGARRFFTGAHLIASLSFDDAGRFADELFGFENLRGISEFVIVHFRPDIAVEAGAGDIARARAVILEGRARQCELLDYIFVGKPCEKHPSGVFPLRKLRGFCAEIPFSKPTKKGVQP